jgi:arylsulfate sulfotransferase
VDRRKISKIMRAAGGSEYNSLILAFAALIFALIGAKPLTAQISVGLEVSQPSPVPLGTVIGFTAMASGQNLGTPTFRFRERPAGGNFHTVVDYGPNSTLNWTTIQQEGSYEIEVSVRSGDLSETATTSAVITMTPLAVGGNPVITPTANPLVFIYSAPPCATGQAMQVGITSPEGYLQNTPWNPCGGFTTNFYLGGMRGQAQYSVQQALQNGSSVAQGPVMTLQTPSVSLAVPAIKPLGGTLPSLDGILLQCPLGLPTIATDLSGNLVWYYSGDISYVTRPVDGGTFMGLFEDGTQSQAQQFFREFDMAGITLAETNAARVNEQLATMGVHAISGFHHEARKLPNGNYLVLADSERLLTGVQSMGPVDIIGDMILVLDPNLQVLWAWDAFDHLDPHRAAILGETCTYPAGFGCGAFYLAPMANDWLHGNALQLTPDGNILYSIRHQDWVIKIDYHNGGGSGNILWKLGAGGDFTLAVPRRRDPFDPDPWFSHQHDPGFLPDGVTLTLYDNGNTRIAQHPGGHSRGQVYILDEAGREARPILNADMGVYSNAVGSAQLLPNGDYHFDSGFLNITTGTSPFSAQSVEVNSVGSRVWGIQVGQLEYRSFRMPSLYEAPY